jgi:glycosyltransferase involved in cell wall biosynthesis
LSQEKGVDLAIEAIGSLDNIHLLIAGDGSERVALERLAAEVAPTRIHIVGNVSDPRDVFAAADVFVLPSRTEGLPAALIEAGMCGLPAVATTVGYVPELVTEDAGILVPPERADAIAAAVVATSALDDSRRQKIRSSYVERFDLAKVANQWTGVLETVLESRSTHGVHTWGCESS